MAKIGIDKSIEIFLSMSWRVADLTGHDRIIVWEAKNEYLAIVPEVKLIDMVSCNRPKHQSLKVALGPKKESQ